jgi:hypothetical protein
MDSTVTAKSTAAAAAFGITSYTSQETNAPHAVKSVDFGDQAIKQKRASGYD